MEGLASRQRIGAGGVKVRCGAHGEVAAVAASELQSAPTNADLQMTCGRRFACDFLL